MARARSAVYETVSDILEKIGDVSPQRIRLQPWPGTATEEDVLKVHKRTQRLYELVDGVLVEKIMGFRESGLAVELIVHLGTFVRQHDLGMVVGEAGAMRLLPGLIRIPDVSFVSWRHVPSRKYPQEPIPGLAPDLAVEVLSEGNTPEEMKRKLKDYFLSGVLLVWYVDPDARTVAVYTAPDQVRVVTEEETLDGGEVLPGLTIPLQQVFALLPPKAAGGKKPGKRRKRS
jgi:Uma2 family endonuclease